MSQMPRGIDDRRKEIWNLAAAARAKPAAYGPDIDLSGFTAAPDHDQVESLSSLSKQIKEASLLAGVEHTETDRAGSFFQMDRSAIYDKVQKAYDGKLEIMDTRQALERYDWLWDYWWRSIPVDKDKYTAQAELELNGGYFIRVLQGQKIDRPIQACLFVQENNISQNVHNIVIMEEGSDARIVTGCALHPEVDKGIHVGVTEFYLKPGSSLSFTMIHNWAEGFHVRPRTAASVEDEATFISNYILLEPVRSIQAYPEVTLAGRKSRASFRSIIAGAEASDLDLGSSVILEGEGTRAESVMRAAAMDESQIAMRGKLIGRHNTSKAHLDCRGILFSDRARIYAVPELYADNAPQSELSHEAAISPIAEEEVHYLMSRGLTEEGAISLITRGFLNIDLPDLPEVLTEQIQKTLEITAQEAL